MDAHEHEPSYYEVALTNRQVVGGFVILLACLFGAFLSGVWLGRDSALGGEGGPTMAAIASKPEAGEDRLERLTFFGGETGATSSPPARRSEPVAPAAAPMPEPEISSAAAAEAEKLRRTLEAEMAEHRAEAGAEIAAAAPAVQPPAPGARVRRSAESSPPAVAETPPAAATATSTTAATDAPTWIQVYASPDGPKAQDLAGRLRRNRFQAVVLEAASASGTTFRVRVGPYANRDEAERAASRLRRDFRLDTWVTDQP